MKNKKIININNLIFNIAKCKKIFSNLCAMVKANAYGHKDILVVDALKNHIKYFGVANAKEALVLRKKFKDINIIVFGKTTEYKTLIKNNIAVTIDCLQDISSLANICNKLKLKAKLHVAINTGMNRLGVKTLAEFNKILAEINRDDNLILEGIFTHAFDADCKVNHYYEQMQTFYKFVKIVKDKDILIHIGGSYTLKHKIPKFVNMVRVGYFMYGYGYKGLKPVMQVQSNIIKIIDCKAGEYIGYGNNTKLDKDSKIAVVPLGYADGLSRGLSGKYYVKINNIACKIVGNICMDMFMADVTNMSCNVGDKVIVMQNALEMAKIVDTSPYEILTSFNQMRCGIFKQ